MLVPDSVRIQINELMQEVADEVDYEFLSDLVKERLVELGHELGLEFDAGWIINEMVPAVSWRDLEEERFDLRNVLALKQSTAAPF